MAARLEPPSTQRVQTLAVGGKGQLIAQQKVKVSIQAPPSHLGTVLKLERARGRIPWVGKQRLFVLETVPWQQNLATHLEAFGPVQSIGQLQGHAADGDDIGRHIVASHPVASCHSPHHAPMLIGHRD